MIPGPKLQCILSLSLVSLLLSLLTFTPLFSSFELKAYDLLSRMLNQEKGAPEIVVVQVDQASLDSLAAEGVTWPWPRQIYAPLFERLSQADAVFTDIIFSEPSSYGNEDDLILADAIAKAAMSFCRYLRQQTKERLMKRGGFFWAECQCTLRQNPVHRCRLWSLRLLLLPLPPTVAVML